MKLIRCTSICLYLNAKLSRFSRSDPFHRQHLLFPIGPLRFAVRWTKMQISELFYSCCHLGLWRPNLILLLETEKETKNTTYGVYQQPGKQSPESGNGDHSRAAFTCEANLHHTNSLAPRTLFAGRFLGRH